MKLGMPALVEKNTINQLVDLCIKLKLQFIELNMNLPYNFIENINPALLKTITKETGIEFTMHMPDEADLGSFYESVRMGYVQLFSNTIDWAVQSGVKLLNMHIIEGAKMTLPHKKVYVYEEYKEEFQNNFAKSIETLSNKIAFKDLTLAIENSSNFDKIHIQNTLNKVLNYPDVALTWDTGHDAVNQFKDREFLMLHENKVSHMHIHDVKGQKDHQVLYEGSLNINELLQFAQRKNIRALIEVKTQEALEKSINNINNQKSPADF